MVLREVRKFTIHCDGYKPNGKACWCDITIEAFNRPAAEKYAQEFGWHEDHRGWICNADGHRGDKPLSKSSEG